MNKTLIESEIRDLREELLATDYKIIKCYEAQLLNEPMPYDHVVLIAERKSKRATIEQLEAELKSIS